MSRFAIPIVGGFMGVVAGLLVGPGPLAAIFADAVSITWDGSSCAAGTYTVVTTASRWGDGRSVSVTSKNVQLPKPTVTQELSNLPPGAWMISAISTSSSGRKYTSNDQAVRIGGDDPSVFAPPARTRPPTAPTTGSARPRRSEPVPPPTEPRSTASVDAVAALAIQAGSLDEVLRRMLAELRANAPDGDMLRQLDIADLDNDGTIDVIRLELTTGEVWVLSVSLPARLR